MVYVSVVIFYIFLCFVVADQLNIIVTINAKDYLDGQHTLEIVGLTQTTEIYRTTVKFYGQGE